MGCFECCIKCLGGVPYASLVAIILCFCGVALFCGCGHVALTGTLTILENHFSTITTDHATLTDIVQLMQYVIYGIASFFFLYGIILLAEGFYTSSAVKELHSDFKTTVCGRCISGMFVFLTYILGIAWLGVFGFSAVPVFLFYNMRSTCAAMSSPLTNLTSVDSICVDVRQYGLIPWKATPGRACGSTLSDICNTSEFYLSYHLFIVACAGAGATVIALSPVCVQCVFSVCPVCVQCVSSVCPVCNDVHWFVCSRKSLARNEHVLTLMLIHVLLL
uniref:Glycoprotein M6Bb n=1 Tax=Cyprinus carpio carpio TaxID=630221 RepID=A0A9J7YZA6_CYPCA